MEIKTKFNIGDTVLDGRCNNPTEYTIHGISYFFGKNIIKTSPGAYDFTQCDFAPQLFYIVVNKNKSNLYEVPEEYLFKNIDDYKEFKIKELEKTIKNYNDLLREYK